MLERIKYIIIILLIQLAIFADGQTTYHAKRIRVDTTNFDNNLSSADNTVQKALETLDEVTGGGGVSEHNELDGLQGGTIDEYYHLTYSDYDKVLNKLIIDDIDYNVFLGTSVFAHDSGSKNVGIGYMAGYNNDTLNATGTYNVYIGYKSGYGATAGKYNNGKYNVGIGYVPLYYNTTGGNNIAIGSYALFKNSGGASNVALGLHTLYSNTSGAHNIAIGEKAGYFKTDGHFNILIGEFTGYGSSGSTSYSYNIYIGDEAGKNTTTGYSNIFIGYAAGDNITEGHNNILIGPNLDLPSPTTNNYMNIGDLLIGDLDTNKLGIGTSSLPVETLEVNGGIKIGTSTNTNVGTIRWSGADFEGYTASNNWVTLTPPKEMIHISGMEYVDSDTIKIKAGTYGMCNGHYFKVTSDTTVDISSPVGEDFYYLYIDDDASSYPAASFYFSTTEPTHIADISAGKIGWYNGDDRCIGSVWVDSSNAITNFVAVCEGSTIGYYPSDQVCLGSGMNPNGSWQAPTTESSVYCPVNAIKLLVLADEKDAGNTCSISITNYEQTQSYHTSLFFAQTYRIFGYDHVQYINEVPLGSSRNIRFAGEDNDDNTTGVYVCGWTYSLK